MTAVFPVLPLHSPPPPPEGGGETVAWYQPTVARQLKKLLVAVAALAVLASAVSIVVSGSFLTWLRYWPVWPVIAVAGWFLARPLDMPTLSAGADWFQWSQRNRWWGVRDGHREYLRCNELREITALIHHSRVVLTLTDSDGRTCTMTRDELQRDRTVWDLLYNGIRHSVANGAKITSTAAEVLRLNDGRNDGLNEPA